MVPWAWKFEANVSIWTIKTSFGALRRGQKGRRYFFQLLCLPKLLFLGKKLYTSRARGVCSGGERGVKRKFAHCEKKIQFFHIKLQFFKVEYLSDNMTILLIDTTFILMTFQFIFHRIISRHILNNCCSFWYYLLSKTSNKFHPACTKNFTSIHIK